MGPEPNAGLSRLRVELGSRGAQPAQVRTSPYKTSGPLGWTLDVLHSPGVTGTLTGR